MLTVTENTKQKLTFHLTADGALDPGTVPVWTIDITGIVGLFPSADGMTCVALASAPGTCALKVTASAGGKTLEITATLTVTQPLATALQLTADVPVAQ